MDLIYQKATLADLDLLVQTRLTVLRAANGLPEDAPLPEVESRSRDYYQWALPEGGHTAYLVFDGEALVGSGAVSFFHVAPTVHNPSGKKAYLMNIYTRPDYRRRGIAFHMVELLVAEARRQGAGQIGLETTAAGRPLYERFGFLPAMAEMELPQ